MGLILTVGKETRIGVVFQPAGIAVAQDNRDVYRLMRPEVEESEMSTLPTRKEWIKI